MKEENKNEADADYKKIIEQQEEEEKLNRELIEKL